MENINGTIDDNLSPPSPGEDSDSEIKYEEIEYIIDDDIEQYLQNDSKQCEQSSGQCEDVLEDDEQKYEEVEYFMEEDMVVAKEEVLLPYAGHRGCIKSESESSSPTSRKRQSRPELWKSQIRKRLRESGEPYISTNNKEVPARTMKPPCNECAFKCSIVFDEEERTNIFQRFWNMTDDEKGSFYFRFVARQPIKRRRTINSATKQFSFVYYLEKDQSLHRVCRTFFLNTLCIGQKRIYYCFAHFNNANNDVPLPRKNEEKVKRATAPNKLAECEEIDNDQKHIVETKYEQDEAEEDEHMAPSAEYTDSTVAESQSSAVSRKRQKNPELWKSQIRKRLRESGAPYISVNNREVPGRTMKPPCTDCMYKCVKVFTERDRRNIFQTFWNMTDDEKSSFYLKFVSRQPIKRRRSNSVTKQFSFVYYLEKDESLLRVCRTFFVNTLCIDQKRIYYCFEHFNDEDTGVPLPRTRGKNVKRVTAPNKMAEVREHILRFPSIDSHPCRANTNNTYIDSGLNVNRMYALYTQEYQSPVAIHIYRETFNNEFNISFYKTKKDQCDKCVMFNNKENIITANEKYLFEEHKAETNALKADRDTDSNNSDPTKCIICYNLQSVFSLPKGNVSTFYYKRKLNTYNLTATVIMPNVKPFTYCALWTEVHSDRWGNDIASALIKILNELVKAYPAVKTLVLWSDPQNKNKVNTTAIQMFINKRDISMVTQKYSEPGHSLIPEVDCVQAVIDKFFKNIEIHSPLHLIQSLQNMPFSKLQLHILPMLPTDFHVYSAVAIKLNFTKVPFKKVKILVCKKSDEFQIKFKKSAREKQFQTATILKTASQQSSRTPKNVFSQKLNISTPATICNDKKRDIKDLLKFLPSVDKRYFENLFKTK